MCKSYFTTALRAMALCGALSLTVGCSEDDKNDNKKEEASIVGTWTYVAQYEYGEAEEAWEHACSSKKDNWAFDNLGVAKDTEYDTDCSAHTETWSYKLSGDKLTVDQSGDAYDFTVLQLDENNLKVRFQYGTDLIIVLKR